MPSMSDGTRDSVASAVQAELGDPTGSHIYMVSAEDIGDGSLGPALADLAAGAMAEPVPTNDGQSTGPMG